MKLVILTSVPTAVGSVRFAVLPFKGSTVGRCGGFFCILIVFIPFYLVTDSQIKTILVQNTHTHTHTHTHLLQLVRSVFPYTSCGNPPPPPPFYRRYPKKFGCLVAYLPISLNT